MLWRRIFLSLWLVLVMVGDVAAQGRQTRPPRADGPTMKSEMREKLANAQTLLAAVMTLDFRTMDEAAERLSRISEMEIGSWQAQPAPPQYAQQAVEFLTSVQALRQAARTSDIASGGAAYTRLTASCVTCHRYARDVGAARR